MSSQISFNAITGPRLVAIAAVFHVFLATTLFVAGRAGVVPGIVDRDGIMGSFAYDDYEYKRRAIEVSQLLRSGNLRGWATASHPIHVKLIGVPFAVLNPIFGYSTLSAEPYNLICYGTIIALVFGLGLEIGGRRTAVLSAVVVGIWPTFLLHTLQLLKDPIFIAVALLALLCAVKLLIRTYRPAVSAGVSVLGMLVLLLLGLVRFSSVALLAGVALVMLIVLIVRQLRERRLLFWNMMPAMAICLTALGMLPLISGRNISRIKQQSYAQVGPLKNFTDSSERVETLVTRVGPSNRFARRISSIRSRFATSYSDAGSFVDAQQEFRSVSDLFRYIPRALEIGMWAPFPSTWFSAGKRVGNVGKLVSGFETLVVYLLQALAVLAIIRAPQRLTHWFVIAIVVCGVTALAFVVPNAGAIYRFRYVFWILLVVIAMSGSEISIANHRRSGRLKQLMTTMMIGAILVLTHGCSSQERSAKPTPALGLTNFTGTAFSAVYLSPTAAAYWQENLVDGSRHNDGDTLGIQFDRNAQDLEWDLKVEGIDGHYAEWKNLRFDGVSEIKLVLKLSPTPVVVAELNELH